MPVQRFANGATSSLVSAITSGSTTLTASDASLFPTLPQFPLLIDSEIVLVTAVAGATYTISRGQEGTTAAAHSAGARVTQLVTAAVLGTLVQGAGCEAYNDAAMSTNNATWTAVTFNSERFDTDGFHSTSSNTSRLTIPAGMAGRYLILGSIEWSANATGERALRLHKNGAAAEVAQAITRASTLTQTRLQIFAHLSLAAGDYVEIFAYQNSGGALNVTYTADYSPNFSIERLSMS